MLLGGGEVVVGGCQPKVNKIVWRDQKTLKHVTYIHAGS